MKSCKEAGNKLLQSFSQAGKSAAASWKKFVQTMTLRERNFRTMRRKSLCKCTENEEAGKAQNRANVRKCAQYLYKSTENCRKLMEKTHGNVLKTHGSALYLINNARKVRYFCVKMTENNEKNEQNMCRIYIKCIE